MFVRTVRIQYIWYYSMRYAKSLAAPRIYARTQTHACTRSCQRRQLLLGNTVRVCTSGLPIRRALVHAVDLSRAQKNIHLISLALHVDVPVRSSLAYSSNRVRTRICLREGDNLSCLRPYTHIRTHKGAESIPIS